MRLTRLRQCGIELIMRYGFGTFLVKLARTLLCAALVFGVIGLPVAGAERPACESCCSLLQAGPSGLSCCAGQEMDHHDPPPHQHFPDSGCDVAFCLASSLKLSGSAIVNSASTAIPGPASYPCHLLAAAVFDPPPGLIADFHHRLSAPPIHQRTCVFLI